MLLIEKKSFDKVNGSSNNQSNNSNNKYQDNNHNNNNNSNGDGNNSNNNGNHSKSCVVNNNKQPEFIGSIINRTGNKIYFPWTLKKKYCVNFADTENTCTRGITCLFDHTLSPSGYHEDGIVPMVNFIDEHKDLV